MIHRGASASSVYGHLDGTLLGWSSLEALKGQANETGRGGDEPASRSHPKIPVMLELGPEGTDTAHAERPRHVPGGLGTAAAARKLRLPSMTRSRRH